MKYMGSKNRIAKHLLPIILKDRKPNQWYVEPFVGGANMIDKVDGNRIGADSNKYVIALLDYVSKDGVLTEINKEKYQSIKNFKNDFPDWLVGYAGICCSYSGKWFGGYAGEVNTKCGIRNYQKEALSNVEKQRDNIKGVLFSSVSVFDLEMPPNSVIYCDPPYDGATGYQHQFNHSLFWHWCRQKVKDGHQVFVSEYNAPDDFICVWEQQVKSSLSANGKIGGSKNSTEKLFVHESQYTGE